MTSTTFFGVPIEGDISKSYRPNVPQKPAEDFAQALNKVFEHPGVEAVRWRQYTPYFADGDPCVFSLGEAGFKLTALSGVDDETGDYEDGFISSSFGHYDEKVASVIGKSGRAWTKPPTEHDGQGDVTLYDALVEFENAFGAQYNNALLDAFGDHAVVTVTREKIIVDFYEHE